MKLEENILRFEQHRQKAEELVVRDLKDYLVYTALAMECFQAVNALIEIGQYLVANHKLGFPSSYREVFELLHQHGKISAETLRAAARLVYLRNLIAHEYYRITEQELREAVALLAQMEEFIQNAKKEVGS